MSAGHAMSADMLYIEHDSALHRLAPQVKILVLIGFTLAVVATPRTALWAFGFYTVLLIFGFIWARIPLLWTLKRSLIEIPFVLIALAFPFIMDGPTISGWFGINLSVLGLWAAFNLLAKATLGTLAAILLAATTPIPVILSGLSRLRMPTLLLQIATFAIRYAYLTTAEVAANRRARIARGDNPKFLWQAGAVARGLGTLFVRTYERGERVWLAMRARGYNGRLPLSAATPPASPAIWVLATIPVALSTTVAILAATTVT